ncbi:MAG: UbiX family flavin prenyltransferase [Campylobacterota bacterium]|nr:UbiX family flavin prenyltransferase [Campylobacterota bacterium]
MVNVGENRKRIVVGITGASGVQLGLKLLQLLPHNIDVFAIISNSAKETLKHEVGKDFEKLKNITYLDDNDMAACISSGSFKTDGFIIVPCSMNTLAKCTTGISDTLITRVFGVMLKEKRNIVIAPREMPYNTIQLENMTKLSTLGVCVAPPVIGYYSKQQTLDDMENFIIGKWFDLLDIEHDLFKRWGEDS